MISQTERKTERTYSRKTIKAKKVIEEFEQTHNHSWYTNDKYIAHVEFLPGTNSEKNNLSAAKKRCEKAFGKDVSDKLLFRVHAGSESFKLTGSGKRDVKALIAEGVEQAFSV